MQREDLTGKKYGMLTVLHRAEDWIQPSGQHKQMWHCLCDCGKECDVRATDLKSGNTKSCGCFQQKSRGKSTFDDLTGKYFGRLFVLHRLPNHVTPSGQTKTMWRCRCECGKECDVYTSQLKSGKNSCGCLSEEEKKKRELLSQRNAERRKLIKEIKKLELHEQKEILKKQNLEKKQEIQIIKKLEKERYFKEEQEKKANAIIEAKIILSNGGYCSENPLIQKYIDLILKRRSENEAKKVEKKKLFLEENCLAQKYPELADEWHGTKNGILSPKDVTKSYNKKVWWKCSEGHEWIASVNSRVHGGKCPYCRKQNKILEHNIANDNPELLQEWDYKKNELLPSEMSSSSYEIAWWICSRGHSYDMKIRFRTGSMKCGCPYCSVPAKRILKGFNDLETLFPELAKEWHPTKNGDLRPDNVLTGSARKVWWIGKCGHEWCSSINSRVGGGKCPICSHQKLLKGFNDFATTNPELLKEWDYEKNIILPTDVSAGTHAKVWWKCPFGHSYQAMIYNRTGNTHSGCTVCNKENHTSFPEQALFYYVKKYIGEAINSDRATIGMELDIYIPRYKIGIEYDGLKWHRNNNAEIKKNSECKKLGIKLIRIREEGLELYEDCICIVRKDLKTNKSLSDVILKLLQMITYSENYDVDVDRDSSLIYESYIFTRKEKSLQNTYPELAKEWHPTKNGNLTPEMVAPATSKKVWWLGECGHEWNASVSDRTIENCSCPICSGKRIVSGLNDLLSDYPDLCEEWDYDRNAQNGLFPNEVAPHSDYKAWWKCKKCGCEWQSKIDGRTRMKAGCPVCGIKTSSEAKYKPVLCIETEKKYISLKDAEKETGINRACISNCCKGKQKTAGEYHWKFLDGND